MRSGALMSTELLAVGWALVLWMLSPEALGFM